MSSNGNQSAFMVAFVLVIIGALNWGLVGINPEYNLIETLFPSEKGNNPTIRKYIYIAVGIAAIVAAYMALQYQGDVCAGAANADIKREKK